VTIAQSKLLGVLKSELEFLNSGGYHKPSWRPQFVFQDSPTCMNRDNPKLGSCFNFSASYESMAGGSDTQPAILTEQT
jgi:hypothetical protein